MGNAIVSLSDRNMALPTLLGQGPARIAIGGRIRAGIKVLTKKAAQHAQARSIYDEGVAAGHSFEQIEKFIQEVLPQLTTPLIPRNVPWFTVRAQDFPNPHIAAQIMEAYGEARADGVKRLYRFPVIFPADMWQAVMPHEMVVWGANDRKFWSEYSADGRTRFCKCYAPIPTTHSGKRTIRIFGGRKSMLRPDNDGVCVPESCEQYQQRQCNLSGKFIFFIPGIKSISAFELHTNSFYAMNAAIQKFETIAFMRGGRISGFLDQNRTPFYLTKKLMEVPHIDDTGKAVRVEQWIIELEAPIDVTALLRSSEDEDNTILRAHDAAKILAGPVFTAEDDDTMPANAPVETEQDIATIQQAAGGRRPPTSGDAVPALDQILAVAESYGLAPDHYEEYADQRWGTGWRLNAGGRRGVMDELQRHRNDPRGYRDKVLTALDIPAEAGQE